MFSNIPNYWKYSIGVICVCLAIIFVSKLNSNEKKTFSKSTLSKVKKYLKQANSYNQKALDPINVSIKKNLLHQSIDYLNLALDYMPAEYIEKLLSVKVIPWKRMLKEEIFSYNM